MLVRAECMTKPVDPFTGTWQLNAAESKLPWPPRRMLTIINSDFEEISIREETLDAQGQAQTVTLNARFDARDYPVTGSPVADAVAYQRVDARTIKGTIKQRGNTILVETVVIAEDGNTFRGDYIIPGLDGNNVTGSAVHERCTRAKSSG